MKFGAFVRNMGAESTRATMLECAKAVEDAGLDSVFVVDHLALPPDQIEGSGGRYLDPLTTLAFLAGVTTSVKLGVGVLILPYRPAVLTAKQVATLQVLSDDRLILGAGVGWLREEFKALGVDPGHRGAMTDETLAVIRQLFDHDISSYSGEHVAFPEFVFSPRPARPPIWIGGAKEVALERTLLYGDGYFPLRGFDPDEARQTKAYFADEAERRGRDMPQIITGGTLSADTGEFRDRMSAFEESGVDHFIVGFGRYESEAGFKRELQRFVTQVVR